MTKRSMLIRFPLGVLFAYLLARGFRDLMLTESCGGLRGACPDGHGVSLAMLLIGIFGLIGVLRSGAGYVALFGIMGATALVTGLQPGNEIPLGLTIGIGGGFILIALLPVLLFRIGVAAERRHRELVENGVEAVGTVLRVEDTNVTVNHNPRVKLHFRIEPVDGGPPFEATKAVIVPRVEIPRVGDRYPVWYEPANPENWAFGTAMEDSAPPRIKRMFELAGRPLRPAIRPVAAAPPDDPYAELRSLNEQRAAGTISNDEFADRTAEVLARTRSR